MACRSRFRRCAVEVANLKVGTHTWEPKRIKDTYFALHFVYICNTVSMYKRKVERIAMHFWQMPSCQLHSELRCCHEAACPKVPDEILRECHT
jgi:hypothetical protein